MALITCPKCGKQFSDRAEKCPQCGISKEEVVALLKKREEEVRIEAERKAAELERLRKEREAKEAEKARIRAERWKKNRKYVFSLIFIIACVISYFPINAYLHIPKWKLEGGVLTIFPHFSFEATMKDYEPRWENGRYKNVAPWYAKRDEIKSVVIDEGVKNIGANAFFQCEKISSISIPNSVTKIERSIFTDCIGLTSPVYSAHIFAYMPTSYNGAYIISNGIQIIADDAFNGCKGLTSVIIPNSVTSIGMYAFYGTGLTSVTIPNSVTSIGDYAFDNCQNLASMSIGNSVTSIGDYAFYGCPLQSVNIPNSVINIGERAFAACTYSLKSITFGNSVTYIGNYAFEDCQSLTSVNIPSSVTSIGDYAFYGCSLRSVHIPNSVTSIGKKAFYGFYSHFSISLPERFRGKVDLSYCDEVKYY